MALLRAIPALLVYFRHNLPACLRDEAEDYVQETLLAAWGALTSDGEGVVDPVGYLLGIARHKCLDGFRRKARREAVRSSIDDSPAFASRIEQATAEQHILHAEQVDRIRSVLNCLPTAQPEALRLRYLRSLGNAEAAQRMGVSCAEESRLKYRALVRIRLLLGRRTQVEKPRPAPTYKYDGDVGESAPMEGT
ncbi:MAG: RNA polymerase sigma factor [Acidobacteriota bacterium]